MVEDEPLEEGTQQLSEVIPMSINAMEEEGSYDGSDSEEDWQLPRALQVRFPSHLLFFHSPWSFLFLPHNPPFVAVLLVDVLPRPLLFLFFFGVLV